MLEYACYPLLLFIATPWFLHRLGTEQYGHWMLLTATVAFGGVLNTGTGAATIKAISAGIGRAADGETERVIRTSLGIATLGGAVLALLVFSIFLFAGGTLLARMGDPALVEVTGSTAALLIWLEQLDHVFSSAMKGSERFAQAARIEIASRIFQVMVAALVLLPWPGLLSLYLALVLVGIVRLLAKATIARRVLNLSSLRPSLKDSRDILHFAKWGWLQGVGGVMFGVADRILVGSLLGAASLAYYSIASQLAMQIHAASAAGLSVIFPMVSRKLGARDHFSLGSTTKLITAANLIFSGALSLMLFIFGRDLLVLWLGPVTAAPVANILPYLVVAYWLLAMNVTPHYILLSLGRIRFVALSNLVAGSILVLAVSMIATAYGLIGVTLARNLYGVIILVNFIPLIQEIRRTECT